MDSSEVNLFVLTYLSVLKTGR